MKKLLLIIGIIAMILLSAFTTPEKEEKKKEDKKIEKENTITENKPILDSKLKEDIQGSVLEFMKDMKVNPDTCYIPLKK